MADVVPGTVSGTGRKVIAKAGAAVAGGNWVYYDSVNDNYLLADADALASANVSGVALGDAALGEEFVLLESGEYDPGVPLTPGLLYTLSSTPGAMAPIDDLTGVGGSGKYTSLVGRGNANGNLSIDINIALAALP